MSKSKARKQKKPKINKLMYYVLIPLLMLVARIKYRLRIDKSAMRGKKGPFLVLGNHTSPIDFLFFSGIMYPRKLNYVVAYNMYFRPFYRAVLTKFNCISKVQFFPDYNSIKQIKRFLDNDTSVLIFPEGRVTVDGTNGYIAPSIGKLVKWLGYPVVSGITKGGYVSWPKWGKKPRASKISLKLEQILSPEDVKTMSADEIAKTIAENLQYNDNVALIENGRKILGDRIAEGLEDLLYKCPNCKAEYKMQTHKKTIYCTQCGYSAVYNNNGLITSEYKNKVFERIDLWFNYQRETIKKDIKKPDFLLQDIVQVAMINEKNNRVTVVGEGQLSLTNDGLAYKGLINEEEIELFFASANMPAVAYVIGESIDMYENKTIYRFIFNNDRRSTKYNLAVEEIYKLTQLKD